MDEFIAEETAEGQALIAEHQAAYHDWLDAYDELRNRVDHYWLESSREKGQARLDAMKAAWAATAAEHRAALQAIEDAYLAKQASGVI